MLNAKKVELLFDIAKLDKSSYDEVRKVIDMCVESQKAKDEARKTIAIIKHKKGA